MEYRKFTSDASYFDSPRQLPTVSRCLFGKIVNIMLDLRVSWGNKKFTHRIIFASKSYEGLQILPTFTSSREMDRNSFQRLDKR